MRRRVTFSRNVTLSLSRSCVSHCKYCAFATHRPHLHAPDEVERLIDRAARRGVKELLVLTGDVPESVPGVRERLADLGFVPRADVVVIAAPATDDTHHLVDAAFLAAKKAHPALIVQGFEEFTAALAAQGVEVTPDEEVAGLRRAIVLDPFGNRVELIERRE